MTRIELGNFGDHKFYRDGVLELRIDVAGLPGVLRRGGSRVALLPCGGDKRRMRTSIGRRDLGRAGNGEG